MGSYDRDYAMREQQSPFPSLTPVVKWLLILNIGIFLIDALFLDNRIKQWGWFAVASTFGEFRIWQIISFQFLHESVMHVAFNSIGIYFIGTFVEMTWGSRRFLIYYLLCGVGGALFYTLVAAIGIIPGPYPFLNTLVGASAGFFGLLAAIYVIAPDVRVRLFPIPIELTIRTLVRTLLIVAVVVTLGGMAFPNAAIFGNSGGEAGHLGGAIMGFLLIKYPWLMRHGKREKKIIRPKQFQRRGKAKLRPRTMVDLDNDTEVDRILDKINAQGFDSLTKDERATLEKVSNKDS